jgi:hypothetical protein
LVALSGLLTGFGALWLFWMARQSATGGALDNAPFWTAIGVIPLALGGALSAVAVVVALRRWSAVPHP